MNIWGLKDEGHDVSLSCLRDGTLTHHLEAYKMGMNKTAPMPLSSLMRLSTLLGNSVDALALSPIDKTYRDVDRKPIATKSFLGHKLPVMIAPHARSHIVGSYCMSPFVGSQAYCLLWEGTIGNFYEVSPDLTIRKMASVDIVRKVGQKYRALYQLLSRRSGSRSSSGTAAGTLMALISFADQEPLSSSDRDQLEAFISTDADPYKDEETLNMPVLGGLIPEATDIMSPRFLRFAKALSDGIFSRFYDFALKNCTKGMPLVISGGCGYNCDWNTAWRNSGIFSDVFVPPAPGDAGVSIGAAADLHHAMTGSAEIKWDVYSGPDLEKNYHLIPDTWSFETVTPLSLATLIHSGEIVPVAYGRAEIGPRALGHRSILVDPTREDSQAVMNKLKKRQSFRPVAPMCAEEFVSDYFDWSGPSPYMLHFQQVKDARLKGVTHVDGTARVQTVTLKSDPFMYSTLIEFRKLSGVACLSNSSLNFPGKGFLWSASKCHEFAEANNLKYFVAGDRLYKRSN